MSQFKLSMLDLVAVREGQTVSQAIATALQTAQHAERLGFSRYWLAEHHNMPGLACSSTAVLIGHIAAGTQRIRLGAGGIMLPNHAPLVVAEAFGTLQAMYPGRIDLGLGRAPGTDQLTMRALRRDRVETEEDFPREVAELQQLLGEPQPGQRVIASPGAGSHVPIWLLGSSLFSAQLAAARGLPYAFASHFAPRHLMQALSVYRSHFVPSAVLSKPRVIVGVRRALQPPVAGFLESRDPREQAAIADFLNMAVIGGPETVAEQLHKIAEITAADELMLVCDIFDPALRLRALEIAAAESTHQT
jgi:luciferase family oxidoreductase group 1